MSKCKILILVLALFIVISATTSAQPGGGRPDISGDRGDRPPQVRVPDSTQIVKLVNELASELSLSDEVKKEVMDFHFSHFSDVRNVIYSTGDDHKTNRSQMESLRKEFHNDMKKLLSDEQYKKYENYMSKQDPRPERPQRGH